MSDSGIPSRLLTGAIAGIAGTVAMTAVMRRVFRSLPLEDQYPLPPREITERLERPSGEQRAADLTIANHVIYGAATGALMAAARARGPITGAFGGAAVWALSYLGWLPGSDVLRPATAHPWRRTALMIVAHLVWGSTTSWANRELRAARKTVFAGGPLNDAPEERSGDKP